MTDELDFHDRMIDAIEQNCDLFSKIEVPIVKAKPDGTDYGISFMLTPIGSETRYMDGSIERAYAFQISAKHSDQELILNNLFRINRYIDSLEAGDIQSKNSSFEFESAEIKSVPNIAYVDDSGAYMYVSNFQAKLLIKE